jgi:hypothetical protein
MTRATLYVTMLVLSLLSVCVYGAVALGVRVKIGFVFLVVPLASWGSCSGQPSRTQQ